MDPIEEWQSAFERVCDLMGSADEEQLAAPVPATPDWSAQELLAHMIGVGASTLAGDAPDDHNPGWTQSHVDARAGRTTPELLDEWRGLAADLVTWMGANDSRPLGDLTIHEQDLRGALGVPGARDSGAVRLVRETIAGRLGEAVQEAGLAPLALTGDRWTWLSHGSAADAGLELRAPDFDLFRAVTSRRTPEQLRGWAVRGEVGDYLDVFAALGPLPTDPLPE